MRMMLIRCLLGALLLLSAAAVMAEPATFSIVPAPQHVVAGHGSFALTDAVRIDAPEDARAQWIATFLRDKIRQQTGIAVKLGDDGAHRIRLRIDPSIDGEEAYHLAVTADGVTIRARDNRGLFWGVETLRQLLPVGKDASPSIPAVRIADAPAYRWRGVMLDVVRHFYPVDFIKKQIDLMAYYKFDVFHWHLTDDEGWRIQIKRYPKLTSVGAWRTEPDGTRYGGFYTQKQIREVVAYARRRNVMVVPEIEMPGHSSAAIAAYPELSCSGKPLPVPWAYGGFRNADCVGKDSTYTFLENVLDEVMQLFPSPYVHIGSDEVPPGVWADCASCEKLAREHDLDGEEGLHGYFVNRIAKYIEGKGRTMVGWGEALEGGTLDPKTVVEVWRGDAGAKAAFANGNQIILAAPFYMDRATDDRTLRDLYRYNPFSEDLYKDHPNLTLGGEAPLWSERATPRNAEARLYPRLLPVAEHFWNPEAPRDWDDFSRRVDAQEKWLAAQDVAYGPREVDIVDYKAGYNTTYERWRIRPARGFDDLALHYTLDGSKPTIDSPTIGQALDLYKPATVTLAPFRGQRQYQASETFHLVKNLALGADVRFDTPPMWPYRGDPSRLTNGILGHPLGSAGFEGGSWQGWRGADMRVTLDLGKPTTLHSIALRFLEEPGNWVLPPRTVTVLTSKDDKTWKALTTRVLKPDPNGRITTVRKVTSKPDEPVKARYLRVIASNFGGTVFGVHTWILTDQIIVH